MNASIATIHAALDHGLTLLDTGDYYGAGHNELLIGRALRDRRHAALLSVKIGARTRAQLTDRSVRSTSTCRRPTSHASRK